MNAEDQIQIAADLLRPHVHNVDLALYLARRIHGLWHPARLVYLAPGDVAQRQRDRYDGEIPDEG